MAVLGKVAKFAIGGLLGGLLGLSGGSPKPAAQAAPTPMATRDDAVAQANLAADLRKRRGSAADILTGSAGAEAAPGVRLVAGS